jgi:trehalose synthase
VSRLTEVDLHPIPIDQYGQVVDSHVIQDLREKAEQIRARIDGRVVWHINSTAVGGGVAEMLPSLLGYCQGLNIPMRWLVISGNPEFFRITKRLHHALHGEDGDGLALDENARAIYEQTLKENTAELLALVRPGDMVILHDPQTIGLAPYLADHGARVIWRCHIGRSEQTDEADQAWEFLAPYLAHALRYVFSRREYVPTALDHGKSLIVAPSIDALTPKNQDMDADTALTILVHAGLLAGPIPLSPSYEFLRRDGSRGRVDRYADIIRCGRATSNFAPLVTQISRWDTLKDPIGVMLGFAEWLTTCHDVGADLILAGPSVRAVPDDPESPEVFTELFRAWCELPHAQRCRVHLAMLPMVDIEENAAIVNALQRHSAVVVQKSLQEGFGLTVTEAMWKGRPLIASRVGGIQDQITNGENGILLDDPTNLDEFAAALDQMLSDEAFAERLGAAAKETVREHFLMTRSLRDHLELILQIDTIAA